MKMTLFKGLPVAMLLLAGGASFAADEAAAAPKASEAAVKTVDETKLSPVSAKVVRLVQAGIDEKVIVAYVKNNAPKTPPSAEELLYLHELKVPAPVLASLVATEKKQSATEVATVPVASEKVEVSSNYLPIPGAPPPQSQVNGSAVISTPVAAPAPVVVQQPAPPTVVYTQPAPVIVQPPPVYYDSSPRITFGFGFGHFGHFGHHHHGGHWGHRRHH
jgi:hypothetical protein